MSPTTNTDAPKPRVFVSSVIEGFESFRQAAREAIVACEAEPVLINEDLPAVPESPRNACLDGVDSCDAFLLILGERGGWTTPSGKLVTEEEYERARQRGLPIVAILRKGDRDPAGARFAARLSDYTTGQFRQIFDTPSELNAQVCAALVPLISSLRMPRMNTDVLDRALLAESQIHNEAVLRVVIAPFRDEEVVAPTTISTPEFLDLVLRIGHERGIDLFDLLRAKRPTVGGPELRIAQEDGRSGVDGSKEVRLTIAESGLVIVDWNVTGRCKTGSFDLNMMFASPAEAKFGLATAFRFTGRLYDEIDRHRRHGSFAYNVILHGLGYRNFADVPSRSLGGGVTISTRGSDPVIGHPQARTISREVLSNPEEEVARSITLLERHAAR